jgi:hypothetical protein
METQTCFFDESAPGFEPFELKPDDRILNYSPEDDVISVEDLVDNTEDTDESFRRDLHLGENAFIFPSSSESHCLRFLEDTKSDMHTDF